MNKILITGATGNIGFEVIRFLKVMDSSNKIIAGVRNIEKAKRVFKDYPELDYRKFDFEDFETFENALNDIDRVFKIGYKSLSPLKFFLIKKREGIETGMIIVMVLLHYLPRFQKEPDISDFYEKLTGKKATDLKAFINREKNKFAEF